LVFQQTGMPDWSRLAPQPQPYSTHPQMGGAPANPLMQALDIQQRREDFGPPRSAREDFGPPIVAPQQERPVVMGRTAAPRVVAPQPQMDASVSAPAPQMPAPAPMSPAPQFTIPLGGAQPAPAQDPFTLTPEEQARHNARSAFRDTISTGGPIFATMQALQAMNQPAPPTPRTVSGSSVIGLTPEQTSHLLDRVQRQNEVEQQMYQHQQDQLRAEADARAGRVFSAAEAEKNRQHADEIERKRIEKQIQMEKWKQQQPKMTQVSGAPGYAIQETTNPATGARESSVVKLPNADLIPQKPTDANAHGTWVDTYGPDGKTVVKRFITPGHEGDVQVAPSPVQTQLTPAQQADIDLRVQKMFDDAGLPPDVKKEAWGIYKASGEVPNIDYVAGKKHFTTVTNPDGSKTYKAVEEGDQVAPPTKGKAAQFDPNKATMLVRRTFGLQASSPTSAANRKQALDAVATQFPGHEAEINQWADSVWPAPKAGWFSDAEPNYYLPTTTSSTGTRGSDGGNNPPVVERTLKNGTKVKVRMTADGQWEKVD